MCQFGMQDVDLCKWAWKRILVMRLFLLKNGLLLVSDAELRENYSNLLSSVFLSLAKLMIWLKFMYIIIFVAVVVVAVIIITRI